MEEGLIGSSYVCRNVEKVWEKKERFQRGASFNLNHRDRWELLQNIKRGFWKEVELRIIFSLQTRTMYATVRH
ncbi:hypothetical protein TNCV_2818391 [Trichonephila clavipes]|nr:hypothetical protein TNCV_2818391 [Trichonephila clavipes]